MLLFHRRAQQRSFEVPVPTAWAALTAALPRVTPDARFYRDAHRAEWTMERTGFDWGQRMQASVEATTAGGSLVTVAGTSQKGYAGPSMLGPRRRALAASAIFAAMSELLQHPVDATLAPDGADGVRQYWTGHQWSATPPEHPPNA